jgi:glutaminase
VLIAESEQLWTFMQGFADEQSITKSKKMNNMELKLTDRMNCLEWVSRNADYLSEEAISNCLKSFKEQYSTTSQTQTNAFIFTSHQSDIIETIHSKLTHLSSLKRSEEVEKKL